MKIEKWYRGHSAAQHALDNFGIIWLTDDPEYAEVYAEDGGVISVVYIDEDKVKDAPTWEDLNFEPFFPDDKEIEEYKSEGYNGYYFMAGYGYDDYQCLALFDKTPVIKVEKYIPMNENKIRLTEKDINYIIAEATKRIVMNEISWGTAHDANVAGQEVADDLDTYFSRFEEAANNMMQILMGNDPSDYENHHPRSVNSKGGLLCKQLETLTNEIGAYVKTKQQLSSRLGDHEQDKWKEAFGDRTFDDVANEIGDKWDAHFDEVPYQPWDEWKKQNLSKDEQDFNDRNP